MKRLALFLLAVSSANVHADPFASGNPTIGKSLHDKSCTACHASMYGGDGAKIYTRPDHKVKSAEQLKARIRVCNTNAGTHWFPEEEQHVAAYLNATYYHFK